MQIGHHKVLKADILSFTPMEQRAWVKGPDKGLLLKTTALETLGGQFTLSTKLLMSKLSWEHNSQPVTKVGLSGHNNAATSNNKHL